MTPQRDTTSTYLDMIQDCEHRIAQCTDWERNFLASARARMNSGVNLTKAQVDTLEKLWDRVTTRQSRWVKPRAKSSS